MSSGGWVTTKRLGRDDAQIEHDAARAKLERQNAQRRKRGQPELQTVPRTKKKKATSKFFYRSNSNGSNKKSPSKSNMSTRKKRTKYEDDEDYEYEEPRSRGGGGRRKEDVDDFIVDEDEEEEEDGFNSDELPDDEDDGDSFHSDSEEDDDEAHRKFEEGLPSDDDESEEDDDEDEEEGASFLDGAGQSARQSRPSKFFRDNKKKINSVRHTSLDMQKYSKDQAKKRSRRTSTDSLQNLSLPPSKKSKAQQQQQQQQQSSRHSLQAVAKREAAAENEGSDFDDELEFIDSPDPTPSKNRRQLQMGKEAGNDDEEGYADILDDDASPQVIPTPSTKKKIETELESPFYQHYGNQDRSDDDHTPNPKPRQRGTTSSKAAINAFQDDDDDDEEDHINAAQRQRGPRNPSSKTNSITLLDSDDDEDEDEGNGMSKKMAKKVSKESISNGFSDNNTFELEESDDDEDMRVAKKLSLKTLSKKNNGGQKKSSWKDIRQTGGEENPLELSDDSSGDEDEDGDGSAEYQTKEQKAALEILKTAEQLSAHVVTAMRGWTAQADKAASEKALQGIITDGAVTLGKVDGASMSGDNEWITAETMREVCPDVKLADYQLVGVNWMALLNGMECEVGTRGNTKKTNVNGVLADEMGLGKTVQTISFLAYLKYQASLKKNSEEDVLPHLIVVPVSVLKNWMNEFNKFCPDLYIECYHGSMEEREALRDRLEEHLPKYRKHNKPSRHLDCIVAPSTYFSKESSDDRKFLTRFRFNYLVVDEAHILKSSKSMRYQQLQKIKSEHRLLLTGTPVQNTPRELLNMLSFLMPLFSRPGGLGSGEETSIVDDLLEHFVDEKKGEDGDSEAYRKLKQLFAPFVLRRKKDDVLSQVLPPKQREVRMVDLDPKGRLMYENIIHAHLEKNGSKVSAAIGEHLFTNLRKAAHHSLLLRNRYNTPDEIEHMAESFLKHGAFRGDAVTVDKVKAELARWNDFAIHAMANDLITERSSRGTDLGRYILGEDALFESAKCKELKVLVPDLIAKGHSKILIFSAWTSCLDLLECLMNNIGLKFLRMDGSTPGQERQQLIDIFNRDESYHIFLLSTKACGLGINLTAADTCIMHDLDFNPFNDLQAEDRCHRIGQKKTVTVYKLVTKNTVDEDVYLMQEKKKLMSASIMDSAEEKKIKQDLLRAQIDRVRSKGPGESTEDTSDKKSPETIVLD
mmetsp:Transcript_14588/g.35477  ORF Transcript_14588/g.35477 Transcript_14588/m.35477 type:complete len:1202 (+) Transcript_14588:225-3830(+)